MGGGGSSGGVEFPAHMEDVHKDWLGHSVVSLTDNITTSLVDVMNVALGAGGNPWEGHSLTDPTTEFDKVDTRYNEYETAVDALDKEADWDSIIDNAVSKVDALGVLNDVDFSSVVTAAQSATGTALQDAISEALDAINNDIIEAVVDSFEKRSNKEKAKALNRFNATMVDINAVQSSAFLFGTALIEAEHIQRVREFDSRLNLEVYRQGIDFYARTYAQDLTARLRAEIVDKNSRDTLVREGAQLMASMLMSKTEFIQGSARLLTEIKRIRSVGINEFELADADLDAKFAEWDISVFKDGMHVLGGMGGPAASVPAQPSRLGSAIGGALSGAAGGALTGAQIGAAGGPIGAGAGAAIGALLGVGQALL